MLWCWWIDIIWPWAMKKTLSPQDRREKPTEWHNLLHIGAVSPDVNVSVLLSFGDLLPDQEIALSLWGWESLHDRRCCVARDHYYVRCCYVSRHHPLWYLSELSYYASTVAEHHDGTYNSMVICHVYVWICFGVYDIIQFVLLLLVFSWW